MQAQILSLPQQEPERVYGSAGWTQQAQRTKAQIWAEIMPLRLTHPDDLAKRQKLIDELCGNITNNS